MPDQVIQYALGIWGKEAVEVMDPDVKDKILNRPREEWTRWEQPEPTLHELRQKYGIHLSDEDLILHFFAGEDYVNALPNGGKPRDYLDATQPLVKIIEQLANATIKSGLHPAARAFQLDGKAFRLRRMRDRFSLENLAY